MVEAARTVEHAGVFLRENDKDNPDRDYLMRDDPRAGNAVKVYHNVFMNLREKVSDYLAKKMEERHAATLDALVGEGDYEKARIKYAKELLAVTDEYLDGLAEPKTEAERAERRLLMEPRSIGGRMEFRKHFEKGDEKPIEMPKEKEKQEEPRPSLGLTN